MVAGVNTRRNFINSAISVLQQYGFDGLNLDWRWPSGSADRPKLTTLCENLKTAFKSRSLLISATVSGQYAMSYWVSLGAPAAKLNMGIAAFGLAWTLADPNVSGVGAATNGSDANWLLCGKAAFGHIMRLASTFVMEACIGFQGKTFLMRSQKDSGWVAHIKANGYGGACVWAVDLDDYTGQFCQAGSNPFISYLKSIL
ncbi:hypothetical protein WMY93_011564 [Mugilogobius chulae]|uniref:GH18 domain-containing protein n=1 Tax=Mugilogobius chulae TaxID=88201 RepID=A0AAW0PF15_9GOBI